MINIHSPPRFVPELRLIMFHKRMEKIKERLDFLLALHDWRCENRAGRLLSASNLLSKFLEREGDRDELMNCSPKKACLFLCLRFCNDHRNLSSSSRSTTKGKTGKSSRKQYADISSLFASKISNPIYFRLDKNIFGGKHDIQVVTYHSSIPTRNSFRTESRMKGWSSLSLPRPAF